MAFKIGEKYKCIKAPNGNFTEGKVYNLERNYAGQTWLRGNDGLKYTSEQCTVGHRLNTTGLQFEKVQEEKEMKFRKGDIVEVINEESFYGVDYLVGTTWVVSRDQESGYAQVYVYDINQKDRGDEAVFWDYNLKLFEGEKPKFDLNKLTTEELREYVELVEDKENAEFLLECFIEKVSK